MDHAEIRAYDVSGNVRSLIPVRIGDEIDWKRHGTTGAYRCRILGFSLTKRINIRVLLLSHDGRPKNGAKWITDRGILRVYPQPVKDAA